MGRTGRAGAEGQALCSNKPFLDDWFAVVSESLNDLVNQFMLYF